MIEINETQHAVLVDWPKALEVKKLRAAFGAPAWVVNEAQLAYNVGIFEKFTGARGRIFYPVKTNPALTVLQLLAKLGVGADCASNSEVELALFAGIKIENVSYNSPVQDVALCKALLLAGGKVVMDDIDAILALQNELKGVSFEGRISLRINLPEFVSYAQANDNQELMAHGHKSSKFGIPAEDLAALLPSISLPISGLHVHVGTQMDNMASFEFAISKLNSLADELNRHGHPITDINIGGGLGIPFSHNDRFPALEFWADTLLATQRNNYQYSVEPGHALVGNTVALLTEVLTVKNSRGKRWAILDVGTDQLAKITLLRWPHRILNEAGEELPKGGDAVAGPLCFAGDTLLENVSVDGLKKGSLLLVTEVGGYTYAMTNKFNGRLGPRWLLLKANGEITQTIDQENSFDNPQLLNHEWQGAFEQSQTTEISKDEVVRLSSPYLTDIIKDDSFSYQRVIRLAENTYEFTVMPSSKVSFISMPLAIRIFGDAGIVAILHKNGYSQKEFALWGRRISMDCFSLIRSDRPLKFTLSLSEEITNEASKTLVVRFKTSCGKCAGSFIGVY